MNTIEVRSNRKKSKLAIAYFLLVPAAMGYFVFLSGSPKVTGMHKYIFAAMVIYFGVQFWTEVKKGRSNIPYLIFSQYSLKVYNGWRTKEYMWRNVTNWKIAVIKDESHDTCYLNLTLANSAVSFPLDYLDTTPSEINDIINNIFELRNSK